MSDETPTPARLPFHTSFRFLDGMGFEHILSISAESFDKLAVMIAEAEVAILESRGKPLMSANLRLTSELDNPAPAPQEAPAPAPAAPVNGNGSKDPVYVDADVADLPDGTHLFTVKEVYHDTNQDGSRHMLKVVLAEDYKYGNGKWGINCFHPESAYPGWRQWEKGKRYSPTPEAAKVIVRDPKNGGKWADVVAFKPA